MRIKFLALVGAAIFTLNVVSCSKTPTSDTTPTVDISVTRDKYVGSYICTVPSSGASIRVGDVVTVSAGSSTNKIIFSKNSLEGTVSSNGKFILTDWINADKTQKWSGDGSLVDKTLTFNLTIGDPVIASQSGKTTLSFTKQ